MDNCVWLKIKKGITAWLPAGLAILLLQGGLTGPGWGAEFSARIVTRSGGQESYGRIYVKGKMIRRESDSPDGLIIVTLLDQKIARIIRPAAKIYTELPLTDGMINELQVTASKQAQMKRLGAETVAGYDANKFETSFKGDQGTVKHFMWVAKKLDMPIKIVSPDGSFSLEYRDIKEEKVDAALFEPPSGYQKLSGSTGLQEKKK